MVSYSSRCQEEETRVTPVAPVTSLPTSSRKRRRNTACSDATSDIMGAFLELQRQQHAEHMEAEELRHRREREMFGAMEEHRPQENRNMFQQLYAAIRPSHPHLTTMHASGHDDTLPCRPSPIYHNL
ncbi:unnamed protein product [Arctogadus glacialis]